MKKSFKMIAAVLTVVVLSIQGVSAVTRNMTNIKDDIYDHLENWDKEFKISYFGSDIIDVIRESAAKDDYLSKSLISLRVRGHGNTAYVTAEYRTSKEEEEYVDSTLKNITAQIINENMNDYDKVKAINDYLTGRVDYDDTLQSNNAYLALTTDKTTCQGYAMTAYKMFKMAGINNKIVLGTIDGVAHGWNEVQVGGKWYNIDITNNDATGSYMYFLRSDDFLKNKGFKWDDEQEYMPCAEDYQLAWIFY
ncbi:transglutaminase-like domain-containing protein [uncultured Clostridium sp.]|uniref:transglutaminase domain-containing protein n=1 Tax=uncultured Clostridium sp. TaxID=59620 RepID=UPI0025E78995|nr:transglutaminase-like domain-containing protein [uncultured Clostridium sp.]